ncbi:MAG TPA: polymorphic toxin-type HINT domain-containing protein [Gemmataceae bacterium]|nr:polymorphic toxin-type HINT domain-containing protein [Gemmataceae bacterium]
MVQTFSRTAAILKRSVNGRVIGTTAEHPFWVLGRGWTPAGALRIGHRLLGHDGQVVPVVAIEDTGEFETVYNLEVEEYHTYFVGAADWGWSVWAHNSAGCKIGSTQAVNPITRNNILRVRQVRQALEAGNPPDNYKTNLLAAIVEVEGGPGGGGRQSIQSPVFRSQGNDRHAEYFLIQWLEGLHAQGYKIQRMDAFSERQMCIFCTNHGYNLAIDRLVGKGNWRIDYGTESTDAARTWAYSLGITRYYDDLDRSAVFVERFWYEIGNWF